MKEDIYHREKNICGKQIHLIRTGQYDEKHKKMTQDALAEALQAAGINIDRTAISRIESGERFLRDTEILVFAKILDVPINVLFSFDDDNK